MRILTFIFLTSLVTASALCAQETNPNEKDLVKSSLLCNTTAIQPGQPFQVGVLLDLAPHWHVYWTNVGEAGLPTTVELSLPEGFKASAIQYPVPARLGAPGDIIMFGYEDHVMLLATITPPAKIDQATIQIGAKVDWLVCENSCIQGNAKLNLIVPVGTAAPSNADLFSKWTARLPVPADRMKELADYQSKIAMNPPGKTQDKGVLILTIHWKSAPPSGIDWFPPACEELSFDPKSSIISDGNTTTVTASFELSSSRKIDSALESVLAYQSGGQRFGVTLPIDGKPLGK